MPVQKKLLRDLTKSELKLLRAIAEEDQSTLAQCEAVVNPAIAILAELKRLGFIDHPVTGDQARPQEHLYLITEEGTKRIAEYDAGTRTPLKDPTLRDEKLPDPKAPDAPKGLNKARAALEAKDAERRKQQEAAKPKPAPPAKPKAKKAVAARVDPTDEG